jgi:hypothetical protein
MQVGPRGEREKRFYQHVLQRLEQEMLDGKGEYVFQPLQNLLTSNLSQQDERGNAPPVSKHLPASAIL